MRLEKIQAFLKEKAWKYSYTEQDGVGSIDFENRGLAYHIWEFSDEGYGDTDDVTYGAESNVRTGGRQEDFYGDYEEEIIEVIRNWK
ncbi:MAG: kinase [Eubacteriales bacterium]|nr:kinase [Eubacteriales bacterium]